MSLSREAHYEPKVFKVGQLSSALSTFLARFLGNEKPSFRSSEDLEDGSTSLGGFSDPVFVDAVCDLGKRHIWTDFRDKDDGWLQIHLDGRSDLIRIEVTAESGAILTEVLTHFETHLDLTQTKAPDRDAEHQARLSSAEQQILGLNERVTSVERSLRQLAPRLRCFLSYRFGDANDLVALHVQRLLALLDVEVLTGQGYEPRRISDKVLDKLDRVHFVVLLVLKEGESLWTRDEISAARRTGVYVIPLVEEGARFEPGLFGDLEWISFGAGHVGDGFLKLLEAVRFIRTTFSPPPDIDTTPPN